MRPWSGLLQRDLSLDDAASEGARLVGRDKHLAEIGACLKVSLQGCEDVQVLLDDCREKCRQLRRRRKVRALRNEVVAVAVISSDERANYGGARRSFKAAQQEMHIILRRRHQESD